MRRILAAAFFAGLGPLMILKNSLGAQAMDYESTSFIEEIDELIAVQKANALRSQQCDSECDVGDPDGICYGLTQDQCLSPV